MEISVYVFLFAVVFTIYQLAAILLNTRIIRRLRDIRFRDETQRKFGIARHALMELMIEDEIKSDSATFNLLYNIDTTIMRHPDKYKQLSQLFRERLLDPKEHSDNSEWSILLAEESKSWTPQTKEMISLQISAMNSLLVLHSSLLRLVYDVAMAFLPHIKKRVKTELGIFTATTRFVARQDQELAVIVESKEELKHLAGFA